MKFLIATLVALAGLAAAPALQAAQLTNQGDTTQNIKLVNGDEEKEFSVQPGETIDLQCASYCVLIVGDNEEYELRADDVITMRDGDLDFGANDAEQEDAAEDNSDT